MADQEIQDLRTRSQEGDAVAQFELACRYADGDGVPRSEATAYRWFLRAAEGDHVEAMASVGRSHHHGLGAPRDHALAAQWYERALALGSDEVHFDLGELLAESDQFPRDLPRALALLREGFERHQDEECAGLLAELYEEQLADQAESVRWLRIAADAGHASSMVQLGFRHRFGDGVPRSFKEMLRWYRAAAEQDDPVALGNLAVCYANGEGVTRDLERAYELRQRASELGHVASERWLAFALVDGTGIAPDLAAGRERLEGLAQDDPEVAHDLAVRLIEGVGLDKDVPAGLDWLRRSAEAGFAPASTYLGVLAWYGEAVPLDRAVALDHYRHAASLGDAYGAANLGFALMEGEHLPRDVERGRELVTDAARRGNAQAALWIAKRHLEGSGGFELDPAAAKAVLEACMLVEEDGDVLFQLAEFAEGGIGGQVELRRALELYQLAQVNGRDVRVEVGRLRKRLREGPPA
ncbi:MAG: tetratricopeptide repeat protein [Planctomycetota bacterium]